MLYLRRWKRPGWRFVPLLLLQLWVAGDPGRLTAEDLLIPERSRWRFLPGTNEASLPDIAAWRQISFSDATWSELPAAFYYGEAGYSGTVLNGMQNVYSTVFLRRTFVTGDPALIDSLTLTAICDDGYLAWINGVPVASLNPPAAPPAFNSLASANIAEPIARTPQLIANPAALLRAGTNVLAVQVFNVSVGSSDLVFDAQLTALPRAEVPLRVAAVSPVPGILTNLTSLTVTFSEAVTGLVAGDLLLNDLSATSVTGNGTTYTFAFPQPAFGTVQISWDPQRAIATVAPPARPLLTSTPDNTWAYELVDPRAPKIASLHPPAGRTVRSLSELDVSFDKAVTGIDAADLRINGVAATNLTGTGAGPYRFTFPTPAAGGVTVAWASDSGIASDTLTPSLFEGGTWSYVLNPTLPLERVILSEFLSENFTGLQDEEGDVEPWIELFNPGTAPVNLEGWSLTDDMDEPGAWVFPAVTLPARGYLVVFASGKDRRPAGSGDRLHTNFKLSPNGEHLALYSPDAPRQRVDALEPSYPPQGPDHSYALNGAGQWRYYRTPTPAAANGESGITNRVEEVRFSVERGFYATPFELSLHCPTPGSVIYYTTNGSVPAGTNGIPYTGPLPITGSRVIRAAAFRNNHLPSPTRTHTYLFNLPVSRRYLPALSIVTATNHLYGTTGIMEYNPRNTTKHGIAWERPVSVELIRPTDNGGFQVDSGLRVAGGGYIRDRYNYRASAPPENKYSFRLYFRGDYGAGRLNYPLFPGTTVDSFDTLALRAGMNDHTNPYIRDELARQLASDVGQVASHGTFVNLFINGVYKGYYNPAERIDGDFLQTYHGLTNKWDLIASMNELREGDLVAWNALKNFANTRDLTIPTNYVEISRQLDLTNFVEYLLPLIYADTDDWPHNNWRAARPRIPGGQFRFYVWDAEWSFGFNNSASHNTISSQLSSTSPPWGTADIQKIFNALKRTPEFKLLFADRVHRHLFNGGALSDARIRQRHDQLRDALTGTISGFNNTIATSWIPARRAYLLNHLSLAGFLASSNAPAFNAPGGRVPAGFNLTMTCANGTIYYTTNGNDPRIPFTGAVAPDALPYANPIPLTGPMFVRARTLLGTNWSAITEAAFAIDDPGLLLAITELMYHPLGGDAYEFIEIRNLGNAPIQLQDFSFLGVDFRFPIAGPPIPPGAAWVIAANDDPVAFGARYPELTVAGYFGGSLANGGETVALLDPQGRIVCAVTYADSGAWPTEPDGSGLSLEIIDPRGDPNDPANWQASSAPGGSPGAPNAPSVPAVLRLNEIAALNRSTDGSPLPDWAELHNTGTAAIALGGYTLSDSLASRSYRLPEGTSLAAGGHLLVWFDTATNAPGLHTGFGLDAQGEELVLADPTGRRVDVVRFGPQIVNHTIGRVGPPGDWELCEPTPAAPNEAATLASPGSLRLNELLANPDAGSDDWVELHNQDASRPAALRGLHLGTTNTVFQIRSLSFVEPAGFVRLWADEQAGPDHLSFRLPASGATLILSDSTGAELDRIAYGSQLTGVSSGRLPDGSGVLQPFPGSTSPGASNYLFSASAPLLNEVMARNLSQANPDGHVADWIELHNPAATNVPLADLRLTLGPPARREWTFPAGVSLLPGGYLVVWCDGSQPASTNATPVLYTGWPIPGEGADVQLLGPQGQILDRVTLGHQVPDASVGRTPSGLTLMVNPTPGGPNATAAPLGSPLTLRLNEWMTTDPSGPDWFELFNPDPLPVQAGGLFLTDDPSLTGQTKHRIPPLTFIAPQGFALWQADGDPDAGPGHVNFSLDATGETLRLNLNSNTVIDAVTLSTSPDGVSEGRWPDGSLQVVRFPGSSSPGRANYLPIDGVVISELLTHTDPPLADAIELQNRSTLAIDLSHWFLSDDPTAPRKYQFPAGTVLPPGAFLVVDEAQFNSQPGVPPSFALSSARGGSVVLSAATAAGDLLGLRSEVEFGASANGVSLGRYETSQGAELAPQVQRTLGQLNSAPKIGPVVLTEIHAAPLDATNHSPEEFIELFNSSPAVVDLFDPAHPANTWGLRGDVDFRFPPGLSLPPGGLLLIVDFEPTSEPLRLAAFQSHYAIDTSIPILGPYDGTLDDRGARLELVRPDTPQGPGPDAGYVPQLRVDLVDRTAADAWPLARDNGLSLHRRSPSLYGNEPLNWQAATPTPGSVAATPPAVDADGDGIPDAWETAHGLDPRTAADAWLDADNDSRNNWEEYVAGTDPRDAASLLYLELLPAGAEHLLRFQAEPERSYRIESCTDLGSGRWDRLIDVPARGTREIIGFYLPVQPYIPQRYFRLVTPAGH